VTGRIARLSLAALRMAAARPRSEPATVARWLYRFGTVPRGPALDRDFGTDDDPMAVLGLTVGGRARRTLEAAYDATSYDGWFSFARVPADRLQSVCKLYVSPRPEALADAFLRIATVFAEGGVRSFKVGRGIEGLLRPDKIVAYFEDRAHRAHVAEALRRSLLGCPAQGVPFSEEAGGDGLLSGGVDPQAGDTVMSWRSWVTTRLASALTSAPPSDIDVRVNAALDAIRTAGVDPGRWTPTDDAFGLPNAP
jgi:hypothetical protein